jgi:site-specific recombinase XerD
MLSLPIYLRVSTYYLHTRVNGRQIKKSLQTSDKQTAIFRACRLLELLGGVSVDLSNIRKYEIDLARGVAKSDGPEDHQRMLEALKILQSPVAGAQTQTAVPLGSSPSSSKSGLRLLEVLDKMILLKGHLKEATVLSYKNTITEFSDFLKKPYIDTVMVSDVTRFQEHLAKKKNQTRTIDNKTATIRALFNFAIKQGYFFSKNPAEDRSLLSKKQKEKNGYAIFEQEDIQTIFRSEFFTKQKTEDPDYYWTLVLGVVTGCRISEITGLTSSQILKTQTGVSYLRIKDAKTSAGERDVPFPSSILTAGFANFIEGKTQIFKYKLRLGKGSGNAVGKKFSRHIEEVKLSESRFVFHSLRKFVNDFMMNNGVQYEPRCQFMGHEVQSVNINTYSNKIAIVDLAKIVAPAQSKIMTIAKLFPTSF